MWLTDLCITPLIPKTYLSVCMETGWALRCQFSLSVPSAGRWVACARGTSASPAPYQPPATAHPAPMAKHHPESKGNPNLRPRAQKQGQGDSRLHVGLKEKGNNQTSRENLIDHLCQPQQVLFALPHRQTVIYMGCSDFPHHLSLGQWRIPTQTILWFSQELVELTE